MNRDFLEMIKTRRSTRSFKPDSIPEDLLDAVLEAGTYAPTGMNRQSPVIIAVSDKKYREMTRPLSSRHFLWTPVMRYKHNGLPLGFVLS